MSTETQRAQVKREPDWSSGDGRVELYCGDCMEVLPGLGIGDNDAIVTDPPYGIGYEKGSGGHGKHNRRNMRKVLGDDKPFSPALLFCAGEIISWGADHYSERLPRGRWLAWSKAPGMQSWDSFSDVEFAWHSEKGAARIFEYLWKGICVGDSEDKNQMRTHPTQKPVCLMRWCIDQLRRPAELICDPFMGSGTTGVAAVKMGRRFIGIELDEGHFKTAVGRIEKALGEVDMDMFGPGGEVKEVKQEQFIV